MYVALNIKHFFLFGLPLSYRGDAVFGRRIQQKPIAGSSTRLLKYMCRSGEIHYYFIWATMFYFPLNVTGTGL